MAQADSDNNTVAMSDRLVDQNFTDTFCETLTRIDRVGSCRRLIFTVRDITSPGYFSVVAKIVISADQMAALAQMIAADAVTPVEPAQRFPLHTALN
jgi:hypothetical protein